MYPNYAVLYGLLLAIGQISEAAPLRRDAFDLQPESNDAPGPAIASVKRDCEGGTFDDDDLYYGKRDLPFDVKSDLSYHETDVLDDHSDNGNDDDSKYTSSRHDKRMLSALRGAAAKHLQKAATRFGGPSGAVHGAAHRVPGASNGVHGAAHRDDTVGLVRSAWRYVEEHPARVVGGMIVGRLAAIPIGGAVDAFEKLTGWRKQSEEFFEPKFRWMMESVGFKPIPDKGESTIDHSSKPGTKQATPDPEEPDSNAESEESEPEPVNVVTHAVVGPAIWGGIPPERLDEIHKEAVNRWVCMPFGGKNNPYSSRPKASVGERDLPEHLDTLCAPGVFRAVVNVTSTEGTNSETAIDVCVGFIQTEAQCAALSNAVGFEPLDSESSLDDDTLSDNLTTSSSTTTARKVAKTKLSGTLRT